MSKKLKKHVRAGLFCAAAAAGIAAGCSLYRYASSSTETTAQTVHGYFLDAEEILGTEEEQKKGTPADLSGYASYSGLTKYRYFECSEDEAERMKQQRKSFVLFYASPEDEASIALMPVLNAEAQAADRDVCLLNQAEKEKIIIFYRNGEEVMSRMRSDIPDLTDDRSVQMAHDSLKQGFALLEAEE